MISFYFLCPYYIAFRIVEGNHTQILKIEMHDKTRDDVRRKWKERQTDITVD